VQIVGFPQSGVMRGPGILDLLDTAVRKGADLVGGIDPLEIDRDPKGYLDGLFPHLRVKLACDVPHQHSCL
jgi:hypothetical protein